MQPGLAEFLERHSLYGVRAYVVALLAVAAATAFRLGMNPVFGDTAPYAFQAIVLLGIASFCGHGASLFGLGLALVAGWFIVPPHDQPIAQKIANEISIGIAGAIICLVTATMRSALITAATARREADFLGREMHHRVKNLFAVVGSMMTLSAREKPAAHEALTELRARLQALADAHDVAVNAPDFINLQDLVDRLMAPHGTTRTGQARVKITGRPVHLPAGYTTPLGLILNELTTNAVKYGSLGTREGSVRVSWTVLKDMLEIRWEETGATRSGAQRDVGAPGFGSLLVEASVAQLRGRIDRNLTDEGLVVRLSIPFPDSERKQFRSVDTSATQAACDPPRSFLSVLRGSKRFFRRKPQIRDSRS